jgi:hypothetical protein
MISVQSGNRPRSRMFHESRVHMNWFSGEAVRNDSIWWVPFSSVIFGRSFLESQPEVAWPPGIAQILRRIELSTKKENFLKTSHEKHLPRHAYGNCLFPINYPPKFYPHRSNAFHSALFLKYFQLIFFPQTKGIEHLGNLGVDGSILLKCV